MPSDRPQPADLSAVHKTAALALASVMTEVYTPRMLVQRPQSLYHFTDASGVLGILGSGTLRASLASAMGDRSELFYTIDVTRHVLRTTSIGDDTFRGAIDAALDPASWFGPLPIRPTEAYVASFCKGEDSALVWLNYGRQGAGFALRIDPTHIVDFVAPVEYEREAQEAFIAQILAAAWRVISDTLPTIPSDSHGLTQALMSQSVAQALWIAAAQFKDPAFRDEQEWRLIYTGLSDDTKRILVEKIEYRASQHRIVPYVSRPLPKPIPVTELILGHSNSMLDNDPALQIAWRECIGSPPANRRSRIPVRP